MARLPITVTLEDDAEPRTLVAQPIDFVMWERHTGRAMSDLGSRVGMEDLAYLAWSADRRSPGEHPPFDVWLRRVVDLEEQESDGEDCPTCGQHVPDSDAVREPARPIPPGRSDGSTSS